MNEFLRLPYPMSGFHALTRWLYQAHEHGLTDEVLAAYEHTRASFERDGAGLAAALLRNEYAWLALGEAPVERWMDQLADEGPSTSVDRKYRKLVRVVHLRQLYFPDFAAPALLDRLHLAYTEARQAAAGADDLDAQALLLLHYMHLHGPTRFLEDFRRHIEERLWSWLGDSLPSADQPAPPDLAERPWQQELRRVRAGGLHVGQWQAETHGSAPSEKNARDLVELVGLLDDFLPDLAALSMEMTHHLERLHYRHVYTDVFVARAPLGGQAERTCSYLRRGKAVVVRPRRASIDWQNVPKMLHQLRSVDAPHHLAPMPDTATTRFGRRFDHWCRSRKVHLIYPWAPDAPPARADQIREHILLGAREALWGDFLTWERSQKRDANWLFLVDPAGRFNDSDTPYRPRRRMVVLAVPADTRLEAFARPPLRHPKKVAWRKHVKYLLARPPFYAFDFPVPDTEHLPAYVLGDPSATSTRFWLILEHAVAAFARARRLQDDRVAVYIRSCEFMQRRPQAFAAGRDDFLRRVDARSYWEHTKVFTPEVLPRDEHPYLPYAEAIARLYADSPRLPDDELRHRLRNYRHSKGFHLEDLVRDWSRKTRADAPAQ